MKLFDYEMHQAVQQGSLEKMVALAAREMNLRVDTSLLPVKRSNYLSCLDKWTRIEIAAEGILNILFANGTVRKFAHKDDEYGAFISAW